MRMIAWLLNACLETSKVSASKSDSQLYRGLQSGGPKDCKSPASLEFKTQNWFVREFEAFKKQIIVDKKKTNDDVEIRVCSGFNTILTIIVVMFLSNCFSSIEPLKYFSHVLFHYGSNS